MNIAIQQGARKSIFTDLQMDVPYFSVGFINQKSIVNNQSKCRPPLLLSRLQSSLPSVASAKEGARPEPVEGSSVLCPLDRASPSFLSCALLHSLRYFLFDQGIEVAKFILAKSFPEINGSLVTTCRDAWPRRANEEGQLGE